MALADWLPMFPWEGPPLPRFLGIYWPRLQSGEAGLSLLPMPKETSYISSAEVVTPQPALTTYENIEEIELVDIDKDLLMPKKIIVHRKSKRLE